MLFRSLDCSNTTIAENLQHALRWSCWWTWRWMTAPSLQRQTLHTSIELICVRSGRKSKASRSRRRGIHCGPWRRRKTLMSVEKSLWNFWRRTKLSRARGRRKPLIWRWRKATHRHKQNRFDAMPTVIEQSCAVSVVGDRKSTRLNSSHPSISRMPSSA